MIVFLPDRRAFTVSTYRELTQWREDRRRIGFPLVIKARLPYCCMRRVCPARPSRIFTASYAHNRSNRNRESTAACSQPCGPWASNSYLPPGLRRFVSIPGCTRRTRRAKIDHLCALQYSSSSWMLLQLPLDDVRSW